MCTNFLVKAGKAGFVNGRSMEFGTDLRSNLFFRKAKQSYHGILPGYDYSWTGKYGFVGMNALDLPFPADGTNTEGLATGALWLPSTEYPTITDKSKGLSAGRFVEWVLSSFATCQEVVDALSAGAVQVSLPSNLVKHGPVHFPVHDAQGNSIVIEFLKGKFRHFQNDVGVVTNDPPFEWHLQNLRNYVGVTPVDAGPVEFGGSEVVQPGHGSGFAALPGDAMPPSRFVRAAVMTTYARPVESLHDATNLAFHILNTVDIPKGTVRYKSKGRSKGDYTQWAVAKNLTERIYSVRFYDSPQVYSINLMDIDLEKLNGKQLKIRDKSLSIELLGKDRLTGKERSTDYVLEPTVNGPKLREESIKRIIAAAEA